MGILENIADFLSKEAGQRRTQALNEGLAYYVPPELRQKLGLLAEMTPTATAQRAGQAGERMMAPDRTAAQRVGDLGAMLSETAGVVAPAVVANRVAMPVAQAVQEGLLGFSMGADDMGRRFVERMNQPGPVPTMYSNPVMRQAKGAAIKPQIGEAFDDWIDRIYLPENRGPKNTVQDENVVFRAMSPGEAKAGEEAGVFRDLSGQPLYVANDPERYIGGGAYGGKRQGRIYEFDATGLASEVRQGGVGIQERAISEIPTDRIRRVWEWNPDTKSHQLIVDNTLVRAADDVAAPQINKLDPNEWRARTEASLPQSWLDKKFDQPQWHGISSVSSDLPPEELIPVSRSTGTLEPEVVKTIESLVGRTGIPALGDRSVAGSEITGIGSLQYERPVRSLGGADFMRERGTGIWANAGPQAEELARTADEVIKGGGDPALIFTAMGPQSADFSTMMAEAVMNQYDPRKIDPAAAAKYDDAVRKVVPHFTSILNPNFLEGLTGTDRWNLWQLMDKSALKKAGFPDINLARRSITDQRLMDVVPFDAGLTIGRPTGGLLSSSEDIVAHPTYPAQLAGAYEGGLEKAIPGPILWRDFFNARRASGASPGSDQRSFLMNANRIAQNIDQQTVDEANQFYEYIRGLNDPSSPFRLWRGLLSD